MYLLPLIFSLLSMFSMATFWAYICQPEFTDAIVLSDLLRVAFFIVRHRSVETINGAAGRRVSKRKAPPHRVSMETAWRRPFSCCPV